MNDAILIINAGSSSLKFAIFMPGESSKALERKYHGQIEPIGQHACFRAYDDPSQALLIDHTVCAPDHEVAFLVILAWLEQHDANLKMIAVGHRVVHGGAVFGQPVIVNRDVIARLEKMVPLAPLHLPPNLAAIKVLARLRPQWIQIACFDTTFHRTIPKVEQIYALPRDLMNEGIRRYGFHGLSYEYLATVLHRDMSDYAHQRVVIAHLGNGASMCAIKNGQSVATTMTFTPLDGLPMATRCGSLDPAVVLYLLRDKAMDVASVSDLLHHRSGLLGISGISGDMRELLASSDSNAVEAIAVFVHRVVRELGSLVAVLGGLDALVFTAGIGEHAPVIRERICKLSAWLGMQLDMTANRNNARCISTAQSKVSVWVIPTDEEKMIAQHSWSIVSEKKGVLATVD